MDIRYKKTFSYVMPAKRLLGGLKWNDRLGAKFLRQHPFSLRQNGRHYSTNSVRLTATSSEKEIAAQIG